MVAKVSLNNPAGRLYSILSRAKTAGGANVLSNFASAFGTPPENVPQIMLNFGLLGLTVDEISEQLKRINAMDTLDIYLESVPSLKSALSIQNLATNWAGYKDLLRDDDLKTLQHCSKDLAKFSSETVLSEEQLTDFKTKIDALYEELFQSTELEPELKRVVLEHLESIRRAIHDYRIKGIRPLEEALCVTALTLHQVPSQPAEKESDKPEKPEEAETQKSEPLMERVRGAIDDGLKMINFINLLYPWLVAVKHHYPQLKEGVELIEKILLFKNGPQV